MGPLGRCCVVAACLASLASSDARADAIGISTGSCPPGLRHGVVHHSDACTPIACTSDADCGAGAACHEIVECLVQQERQSLDGRVVLAHPVRVWVEHGLCHGEHACPEGRCQSRRQCEPTSASAAWDAAGQRWTGTFLEEPEPPPSSTVSPPPAPAPSASPPPSSAPPSSAPPSSSMCSIARSTRSGAWLFVAPAAVALWRRRRPGRRR